jgi:LPXTG-motif cell wall-anchored protein
MKLEYGSLVLNPGESISLTWLVDTPPNAPVGAIAWNSFGYTATRTDNGSQLEAAEPTKVGLQVETQSTPPPPNQPPLPRTGADTTVIAVLGVLLVIGGLVLVQIARPPARVRAG